MPQQSEKLYHHLFELRHKLIFSFIVLCLGFAVCWIWSEDLLSIISRPVQPYLHQSRGKLIFTAPMDEFLAHIKVCLFGAFIFSFPFIIYQVWGFIAPGLYKKEKKILIALSLAGFVLFLSGVLFIYFVVYPLTFKFLFNFGSAAALISIKEYLSFFIQTSLAFGFLFESPIVVLGLVFFNILKAEHLRKWRRYAAVILALISALATPPDIFSMFLLLIPLYLLYELSIFAAGFISVKK